MGPITRRCSGPKVQVLRSSGYWMCPRRVLRVSAAFPPAASRTEVEIRIEGTSVVGVVRNCTLYCSQRVPCRAS